MVSAVVIEGIRAERHRALKIVAACDSALDAFGVIVEAEAPDAAPARTPRQRRATRVSFTPASQALRATDAAPRTPKPGTSSKPGAAPEGKSTQYQREITKSLSHFSKAPSYAADTAVLRREVAKACGVKDDETFKKDMNNALQQLQRNKQIERSGTMWALKTKPSES